MVAPTNSVKEDLDLSNFPIPNARDLVRFKVGVGLNLEVCDREMANTSYIALVSMKGKEVTDATCKRLRAMGYRVGWHFHKGRIYVRTFDDPKTISDLFWNLTGE